LSAIFFRRLFETISSLAPKRVRVAHGPRPSRVADPERTQGGADSLARALELWPHTSAVNGRFEGFLDWFS
jgi:hypothetical protein